MELQEILDKIDNINDELGWLEHLLTEADGATICVVKFRESREQFNEVQKELSSLRDSVHLANWSHLIKSF